MGRRRLAALTLAILLLASCAEWETITPDAAQLTRIAVELPEGPTKEALQATAVARYVAAEDARQAAEAARIAEQEGISNAEITFISDAGQPGAPGLRLELDLGQLLHLFNEHVVSSNNLVGILGSFGLPRS